MAYGPRYREQITPQPAAYVGRYRRYINNVLSTEQFFNKNPSDSEPLYTKRCWDQLNPGPPYKRGGKFTLVKSSRPLYQVKGSGYWRTPASGGTYYEYSGGFTPLSFPWGAYTQTQYNNIGLAAPMSESWLSAHAFGDAAFDSARPKIEQGGLSVFLGELRELPRMLATSARGFHDIWKSMGGHQRSPIMQPKKVADNFLNHQFGWLPFLGDISKFNSTYQNLDKITNQMTRDNGKIVKRRRIIQMTENNDRVHREYAPWVYPYSNISHMLTTRQIDGQNCKGYLDVYKEFRSLVWFMGAFKYYRPEFDRTKRWYDSNYGKAVRLLTLYGARISPSTVWNLMPWSWLVDWFGDVGNAIERAESWAIDGVAAKYAYVMKHQIEVITNNSTLFMPGGDLRISWSCLAESKDRRSALSPYGYSLPAESLSARQIAILAALGLTRAL